MQAMVPNLYGAWQAPIGEALSALLTEAAGDPICPMEAVRFASAWQRFAARLTIRAYWEDILIRPLLHIAAPDITSEVDARHEALLAAIAEIDDRFAGLALLSDGRARRAARREICALLAALISRHLVDRAMERSAMAAIALHFDPLAVLAAERALLNSLTAEAELTDLATPAAAASLCGLADGALLAEATRILAAAARRRGREAVRLHKPA